MSLEFTAQYSAGDLIADRFEIARLIGGGATGMVYLASDRQLGGTEVVLKLLHPHLHYDPHVVARLQNEPTVSRKICSPHLVQVFELHSLEDGRHLITMEYLRGASLRSLIESAPEGMLSAEATRLLREITLGLQAMHRAGYLHRDLKPENILVTDEGEVKLVDFGLAIPIEELDASGPLSIGTPYYTSPELVRGEQLDTRSDFYSLGIIGFELCTGSRPFIGKSEPELLEKHVRAELPEIPGRVDHRLAALIRILCAKNPRKRPADTSVILALLDSCDAAQRRLLRRSVGSRRTGRMFQRFTIFLLLMSILVFGLRRNREAALFASLPFLVIEKVTGADLSIPIHFIGADLNYSDQSFINVILRGDGNGLRILTTLGMDPNKPIPVLRRLQSDLPIFWIVWRGGQFLRDFISAGARIDVRNDEGQTPLMLAAKAQRGELVHFLISDATLELRDRHGYTALCYAFEHMGHYAVLALLKRGARNDVLLPDGTPCAHRYIRDMSKLFVSDEVFTSIIAEGFPLELKNERTGETAIHVLARTARGPLFERLLEMSAAHDSVDKSNYTAIFHAAIAGNVETLKILAAKSRTLDLTGGDDIPLGFFILDGYRNGKFELPLIRSLLEQGLPVNRPLPHSRTTLIELAQRERLVDLYQLLLEFGAVPPDLPPPDLPPSDAAEPPGDTTEQGTS